MAEALDYVSIINANPGFFDKFIGRRISDDEIKQHYGQFENQYPNRPVKDNTGGGGEVPSFWYFLISKLFEPELVIESGVWKGHTTWVFRLASPNSQIYCFDISFKSLIYRDQKAIYEESDWGEFHFKAVNKERSIVFFDDHIDHAQRIIEAHNKGFRYLIMDDGVNLDEVDRVGVPPFPSVQMLFDTEIKPGVKYSYSVKGKEHLFIPDSAYMEKARNLIDSFLVLKNTYTRITLVRLSEG